MTNKSKMLQTLHFPRYAELPDLGLYMDQVISVMERYLSPFTMDATDTLITSTMINNYVKQRLILAPEKKRYGRDHLAQLLICTLLKQVLTLADLDLILRALQGDDVNMAEAYDCFCEELENATQNVFGSGEYVPFPTSDKGLTLLRTACGTYAYQLRSRHLIRELFPVNEQNEEEKHDKGEKKKKSKKNSEEIKQSAEDEA